MELIKVMNVILARVRAKERESECFGIDSGVREGCIMSPWDFNVYMNTVMKDVKMRVGRMEVRFLEEGREYRLHILLCANYLVLCSGLEEDLKGILGFFVKACRIRGLRINADKTKLCDGVGW